MMPTGTAIALGNGPFEGFVPEALTTLFELKRAGGPEEGDGLYVVVSNLPEDEDFEAETSVFAVNKDGSLDLDFYITNNGALIELPGDIPASDVIESLGYEIVHD